MIKQKGFTIVETMIVLAIVGAIMLVVFLAVPALQRNSRNTGLRSDVANVLGAVNEFITNNNGNMPTTAATASGVVTISGAAGTSSAQTNVRGSTDISNGNAAPALTTTDTIVLVFGNKCNGNTLGAASARATAALFNVEGASTNTLQCQES
jgi:prepilin-type N-terminal cleavage/methylation domain-containing protein